MIEIDKSPDCFVVVWQRLVRKGLARIPDPPHAPQEKVNCQNCRISSTVKSD
jgi:hypothetical protein